MKKGFAALVATAVLLVGALTHATPLPAQTIEVPFEPSRWTIDAPRAEFVEHLGRRSLRLGGGSALLKDVRFQDGTIEVDVSGPPSGFAFLVFRATTPKDHEDVYLRMGLSGTADALQYMPMYGGEGSWQLYHGPGYNASVAFNPATWTHLRVDVEGRRATVFVGETITPSLVVAELKGGDGPGAIGVLDGSTLGIPAGVLFSNFRYTPRSPVATSLATSAPSRRPGVIRDWTLSPAVSIERSPTDSLPSASLPAVARTDRRGWLPVVAEPDGLLNIAKYRAMAGRLSLVVARTVIHADRNELRRLVFGYSDDVTIFLNGRPLFAARNGLSARYSTDFGLMTPDDAVYLPLRPGENELLFAVAEAFGGWGSRLGSTNRLLPCVRNECGERVGRAQRARPRLRQKRDDTASRYPAHHFVLGTRDTARLDSDCV